MAKLTEILKGDAKKVVSFGKGFIRGAVHGLYSPFLLTTGLKHAKKNLKNDKGTESLGDLEGQLLCGLASQMKLSFYAAMNGKMKYYVGALVVTNAVDYLVHVYKRAKTPEEKATEATNP